MPGKIYYSILLCLCISPAWFFLGLSATTYHTHNKAFNQGHYATVLAAVQAAQVQALPQPTDAVLPVVALLDSIWAVYGSNKRRLDNGTPVWQIEVDSLEYWKQADAYNLNDQLIIAAQQGWILRKGRQYQASYDTLAKAWKQGQALQGADSLQVVLLHLQASTLDWGVNQVQLQGQDNVIAGLNKYVADTLFEKAVNKLRKVNGLNNLKGDVYKAQADFSFHTLKSYTLAAIAYEKTLSFRLNSGTAPSLLAKAHRDYSKAQRNLSNFQAAIQNVISAKALLENEEDLAASGATMADVYNTLGNAYLEAEQYDSAVAYYPFALQYYINNNSFYQDDIFSNLALCYTYLRKKQSVDSLLQIWQTTLNTDNTYGWYLWAYAKADFAFEYKQYDSAVYYFKLSQSYCQEDCDDNAILYRDLSLAFLKNKQIDSALINLKKSVELTQLWQLPNNSNRDDWRIYVELLDLYTNILQAQNKTDSALLACQQGLLYIDSLRYNVGTEGSMLTMNSKFKATYNNAVGLLNKEWHTGTQTAVAKAIGVLEQYSGIVLRQKLQSILPAALYNQYDSLLGAYYTSNARLRNYANDSSLSTNLVSVQQQARQSLANIKQVPALAPYFGIPQTYTLKQFFNKHPHQWVVYYYQLQDSLHLIATGKKGQQLWHTVPWQPLVQQLRQYNRLCSTPPINGVMEAEQTESMAQMGHALYQALLAPVLGQDLRTKAMPRILLVPVNVPELSTFPWDALLTQPVPQQDLLHFAAWPWAFNKALLQTESSYSALMEAPVIVPLNQKKDSVTVLAAFPPLATPQDTAKLLAQQQDPVNAPQRSLEQPRFRPLYGLRKEAEAIQKAVAARVINTQLHDKAALLRATFKSAFLHFSTHGLANSQDPNNSLLVLKQAQDVPKEVLRVSELLNQQIAAQLVVLSACQTGTGKAYVGEGVYSLDRAFREAGASATVVNRWNANDQTSVRVMEQFYKALASGLTIDQALNQARQAYMAQQGDQLSHPYYWAPWQTRGYAWQPVYRKTGLLPVWVGWVMLGLTFIIVIALIRLIF